MGRLSFKTRRRTPIAEVQNGVVAALARFGADFLESASFKHALSKGEEREVPLRNFFKQRLPTTFRVDKGEVVDIDGRKSPQLDLIITDGMRNAPLREGSLVIMPAEALLVSVEVKSCLTLNEIKTALTSAHKLRQLRPFKARLASRRQGGQAADERCRYFHTIFAYETDLSSTNWLTAEFSRIENVCKELQISSEVLDRVYVAKRGLINVPASTGIAEQETGTAFLQFYMHALNFLLRENRRREETPYIEYAGKMSGPWTSFKRSEVRSAKSQRGENSPESVNDRPSSP